MTPHPDRRNIDALATTRHAGRMEASLGGLVVLAFESRRATEMAELIRRFGGTPVTAPSMREVPLGENAAALAFLDQLERGECDVVILLTGVGTRTLTAAVASRRTPTAFAALLRRTTIVARGPKPIAALREIGLTPQIIAPEPNTWRELLAALDQHGPLRGRRVAVQEYGESNPELLDGLRARGAVVLRVPVYRWALPENPGPLKDGVARFAQGKCDIAVFTSATQVHHVMQTAEEMKLRDPLGAAAAHMVIASIGPVCSEALRYYALPVDLEPPHPKMGQLVAEIARRGAALLAAKRGRTAHA